MDSVVTVITAGKENVARGIADGAQTHGVAVVVAPAVLDDMRLDHCGLLPAVPEVLTPVTSKVDRLRCGRTSSYCDRLAST